MSSDLRAVAAADQLEAALRDAQGRADIRALLLTAMREGHLLACPPQCGAQSCRHPVRRAGQQYVPRVPYGYEQYLAPDHGRPALGLPCLHCLVLPGGLHHRGCLAEECACCGELVAWDCGCA